MGTKFISQSVTGYNSVPPPDDGTVSEANKVKWSTIKTKLSDPLNTFAGDINTALLTQFDNGPTAVSTNTTLGLTHYNKIVQVSGSGNTITLSDAATLTAGWYTEIISTDSNTYVLARATGGDTIDGNAADITVTAGSRVFVVVNAAANGFLTRIVSSYSAANYPAFPFAQIPIPTNLSLVTSVAGNALTIALKGNNGSDPSVTNPVYVPFRNVTITSGDTTWLTITAATSLVVSSGSTLGSTSGVLGRYGIVGFNDAGTFRLGIVNLKNYTLSDNSIASSTAEGGSGAADSLGVIYTGTAVTSKAMKVLALIEATEATAGTWVTAPSKIQLGTSWNVVGATQGASLALLYTNTSFSGSATFKITNEIDWTAYDFYDFELHNVVSSTDGNSLQAKFYTDGGTTPVSTSYYGYTAAIRQDGTDRSIFGDNAGAILLAERSVLGQNNTATMPYDILFTIVNPNSSTYKRMVIVGGGYAESGGFNNITIYGGGWVNESSTSAVNGIQFSWKDAAVFNSATMVVRGRKNS